MSGRLSQNLINGVSQIVCVPGAFGQIALPEGFGAISSLHKPRRTAHGRTCLKVAQRIADRWYADELSVVALCNIFKEPG